MRCICRESAGNILKAGKAGVSLLPVTRGLLTRGNISRTRIVMDRCVIMHMMAEARHVPSE